MITKTRANVSRESLIDFLRTSDERICFVCQDHFLDKILVKCLLDPFRFHQDQVSKSYLMIEGYVSNSNSCLFVQFVVHVHNQYTCGLWQIRIKVILHIIFEVHCKCSNLNSDVWKMAQPQTLLLGSLFTAKGGSRNVNVTKYRVLQIFLSPLKLICSLTE